jgi:hypothetical protein
VRPAGAAARRRGRGGAGGSATPGPAPAGVARPSPRNAGAAELPPPRRRPAQPVRLCPKPPRCAFPARPAPAVLCLAGAALGAPLRGGDAAGARRLLSAQHLGGGCGKGPCGKGKGPALGGGGYGFQVGGRAAARVGGAWRAPLSDDVRPGAVGPRPRARARDRRSTPISARAPPCGLPARGSHPRPLTPPPPTQASNAQAQASSFGAGGGDYYGGGYPGPVGGKGPILPPPGPVGGKGPLLPPPGPLGGKGPLLPPPGPLGGKGPLLPPPRPLGKGKGPVLMGKGPVGGGVSSANAQAQVRGGPQDRGAAGRAARSGTALPSLALRA